MGTTVPIKSKGKLEEFRNYYRNTEPNPRNYALIVLGLNSALRIGDILSLRWKDVYFSEKKTYREHISIVEKKTGKRNVLAINAPSQEALEYYRATLNRLDDDQFIFSSQKKPHNGICRSQAFRIIKKAAQSCGLDGQVSCHSLRKTFGYHAWKNGFPPALLMTIYNHSSYDITKRYLCIDQIEKDEVYLKTFL
ncbi:MAG: tyrosine-type recombinase/integrase [Eubacterium sp.]|jgi:integrase|nr:tyrosine-type recombinase/integrase [Eubacterium sp.]